MISSVLKTGEDAALNSGAPGSDLDEARTWVLQIQTKLHQWATKDSEQRFDDLYNLVCHPATLIVAWDQIRRNRGSRTAGVDGTTRWRIEHGRGAAAFLADIRVALRDRTYRPCAVRRHGIPKAGGKVRYLGIPTIRDRVVQMALKLILEPIFEADFVATSYGFRPGRRAQDAIAEIYQFAKAPSNYEYVVEGDIEACFDRIDHASLMARVRKRIGDRKVLVLVKAFLSVGVMTELGMTERSGMGTPQGGIISPLLANIALSALDEHFDRAWRDQSRYKGRRQQLHHAGRPTYRLIRYADDFVLMVKGTPEQAEVLKEEVATVLAEELKLTLSPAKTLVTHIDDGFDFLGFRIQRKTRNGKRTVYTFPSRRAFESIKRRVKAAHAPHQHFAGAPSASLSPQSIAPGLDQLLPPCGQQAHVHLPRLLQLGRVARWLWKKHKRPSWKRMKRRELRNWEIGEDGVQLFRPSRVTVGRYRYRGSRIPSQWERANP